MNRQVARTNQEPSGVTPAPSSVLQRKCDCGNHTAGGGECEACGNEREEMSNPLSSAFRPSRFDHDFSNVRAQTDAKGSGASAHPFPFPHLGQIERAFGIPIMGRAVIAPGECAQRGAPAFTDRSTTYFAERNPSLKVAAHEAAHLIQHAGLTNDAQLGAETHAAVVGDRVAAGLSAHYLIGERGSAVEPASSPYTEVPVATQTSVNWDAGIDLRVSEDGRMAVGQSSTMHSFWAEATKITESNSILTARRSVIRLREQSDKITGLAPDNGQARSLSKVLPENVATSTSGEGMDIWADCGRSARDVMGAGEGTGGGDTAAIYRDRKMPWWSQIPILGPLLGWIFGMPKPEQKETAARDPEEMKKEIFNERLGGTGDEGMEKYMALSSDEREKFDRETGINRYAAPTTGEGFTMSTGGSVVPSHESDTWNFHWGGVVMNSGDDRVTLENYAVGDASVKNSDWEFQMYGSARKPGQTFHEQHQATGQHGDAPTTMQVRKR